MYIIADPSWGTTNEFEHLFEPMLQIGIFNLGDHYIKASLQDNERVTSCIAQWHIWH
jgi:hypothetical protein